MKKVFSNLAIMASVLWLGCTQPKCTFKNKSRRETSSDKFLKTSNYFDSLNCGNFKFSDFHLKLSSESCLIDLNKTLLKIKVGDQFVYAGDFKHELDIKYKQCVYDSKMQPYSIIIFLFNKTESYEVKWMNEESYDFSRAKFVTITLMDPRGTEYVQDFDIILQ